MSTEHDDHTHDDTHDQGLALDRHRFWPPSTVTRRAALGLIAGGAAGVGLWQLTGGSADAATTPTPTDRAVAGARAATRTTTGATPQETSGPYPADGSNGPDVLDESGIVRRDIRSSFGSASGAADGVNLRIELTVIHAATSKPYPKCAVYLWHCDQLGRYSMYSQDIVDENYLRGIQVADSDGAVRFRSIFPACYSGRWPHIHYEVYPTLADATSASNRVLTSQIALPKHACQRVYRDNRYSQSSSNLSSVSLSTDLVFSDGWSDELATMSGTLGHHYAASLTVAV